MDTHRRKLLVAFAIVASVAVLSSTAYACTTFRGRMTVTNASGTATYVGGNDTNGFMGWCGANPPPWNLTASGTATNSVTISTAAETTGCLVRNSNKLKKSNTYQVGLHSGQMPPGGGGDDVHNCHGSTGTTSLGTFQVGTFGVGAAKSYTYTHGVGWHSICIYNSSSADANAVNINAI